MPHQAPVVALDRLRFEVPRAVANGTAEIRVTRRWRRQRIGRDFHRDVLTIDHTDVLIIT